MKTWKIGTIAALALTAIVLTAASAYAFCWWGFRPATNSPFLRPTFAPTTPSTQYLPPVTETNTQTPTLYTPNTQVVTPGYGFNGEWGGCFGRWGNGPFGYPTTGTATAPLTIGQASYIANTYVASLNNPDLTVNEVEEFTENFYVQVGEKSTGYGAFELLMNKYTGVVRPEMGPNMMWNTKYAFTTGYCNWYRGSATATPTVNVEQAKTNAQQYLNSYLQGTTVGDATTFYGYYTFEVLSNGTTYGMLSVNGLTGQVWYHTWHGTFIQ